jgi:transposase
MPATAESNYVGLDISKAQLDYTMNDTEVSQVANTSEGHAELIKALSRIQHPRVVCEASGGYERLVVAALLCAGVEVCLVQPGRARAFAYAEGLLAKTDRIDALMLRRYGRSVKLRLAVPTDPAAAALRDLLDRRRDVLERVTALECQMDTARATLASCLKRELRFLEKELRTLQKQIAAHIDQDPTLKQKYERLQELKGAGPVLAATLLAYLPELGTLPDPTISALVGVAPHPKDSGNARFPRHIRGGRGAVRHVLYMAAVSASRSNTILAAFYQRLLAKGKPPMVCLIAVMRKMLTVLNRLLTKPDFVLAD